MNAEPVPTTRGPHEPATWAALIARLHFSAAGGSLRVSVGGQWRRIWFVAGFPVLQESNIEAEELGNSLVDSGMVAPGIVEDARASLRDGQTLRQALLARGEPPIEELHRHLRQQVEHALGAPLGWPKGEWHWTSLDELSPEILQRVVLVDTNPLVPLWRAAKAHLERDDLRPFVLDGGHEPLLPRAPLDAALQSLGLTGPLLEFRRLLGDGASAPDLLRGLAEGGNDLLRLLWLLELSGLLTRASGSRIPTLDGADSGVTAPGTDPGNPPRPVSRPGRTRAAGELGVPGPSGLTPPPSRRRRATTNAGKSVSPDELSLAVANDYRKRMKRDYYSFLGLKPEAPPAVLEKACNRLGRRWNRAARMSEIPEDRREMARELLVSVQLVWRTLGDPNRRQEYDRRLSRGQPPIIEPVRAADLSTVTLQKSDENGGSAAVQLMEMGDWPRALRAFRAERARNPSDPDVLARLGWCEWMAGKSDSAAESAQEYLLLAKTFDPGHEPTLEYLSRLALARNDSDQARRHLKAWLQVNPQASWARSQLSRLPAADR
jgi:Tfp pilus assembly protein PilF